MKTILKFFILCAFLFDVIHSASLLESSTETLQIDVSCDSNEFKCTNRNCVPTNYTCDGDNDCGDYSDEQNCESCRGSYFLCKNKLTNQSNCISTYFMCDGIEHCQDNQDEVNCNGTNFQNMTLVPCSLDSFNCTNYQCVPKSYVCDGDNDCGDLSDEYDCPRKSCNETEFQCYNAPTDRLTACIPLKWVCDGENDCRNNQDEINCNISTTQSIDSEDTFNCSDTQFITKSLVCDGKDDCSDGEDEKNCPLNNLDLINATTVLEVAEINQDSSTEPDNVIDTASESYE